MHISKTRVHVVSVVGWCLSRQAPNWCHCCLTASCWNYNERKHLLPVLKYAMKKIRSKLRRKRRNAVWFSWSGRSEAFSPGSSSSRMTTATNDLQQHKRQPTTSDDETRANEKREQHDRWFQDNTQDDDDDENPANSAGNPIQIQEDKENLDRMAAKIRLAAAKKRVLFSGRRGRMMAPPSLSTSSSLSSSMTSSSKGKISDALRKPTALAGTSTTTCTAVTKIDTAVAAFHSAIHETIDQMLQGQRSTTTSSTNAWSTQQQQHYHKAQQKPATTQSLLHRTATATHPLLVVAPTMAIQKQSDGRPNKKRVGAVAVRIATSSDDEPIARLRLSVFTHFTAAQQGQFCVRSCQAIAGRRMRGAVCLVADMTAPSSSLPWQEHDNDNNNIKNDMMMVVASVECSLDEFLDTALGQRRPPGSCLYLREVAVHPAARRLGIGRALLRAMDVYAACRHVETLYLHVDVSNAAAVSLYEKAGYRRVDTELEYESDHDVDNDDRQAMYREFTRSLNLHPGATAGREHFLLCKDLTPNPTWLTETASLTKRQGQLVGSLGFDIPP
jgi:ribosomal protein S18 acetylase RimI-like enzyme